MIIEWWNFDLSAGHINNKLKDVIKKGCISISFFTQELEKKLANFLEKNNIQTRLSNPNFERIKFMKIIKDKLGLKNSVIPERDFLYLPGVPNLKKKK